MLTCRPFTRLSTPARPPRHGWTVPDLAAAYFDGGARLVQLRAPGVAGGVIDGWCDAVVARASGYGAAVVVNDRADVARMSGAAGVHLGAGRPAGRGRSPGAGGERRRRALDAHGGSGRRCTGASRDLRGGRSGLRDRHQGHGPSTGRPGVRAHDGRAGGCRPGGSHRGDHAGARAGGHCRGRRPRSP